MSSIAPLPRSVISFVRAHVDHEVKLRFLLALHSAPNGSSNVKSMAHALDVPKAQVRDMANELIDEGLLRMAAEQLELAPASIEERLALAELADSYAQNRGAVLELLAALRGQSFTS